MAARKGPVVTAVEADLKQLKVDAKKSALAASALALARELDSGLAKASEIAACARALRETLDRLRELKPPEPQADRVDDLAAQRRKRTTARARRAAAARPPRS